MLDRFLDGFFEGLTQMFMFLIFALVIAIACVLLLLQLLCTVMPFGCCCISLQFLQILVFGMYSFKGG